MKVVKILCLAIIVTGFCTGLQCQSCYDIYEDALFLSNEAEFADLTDSILDFEILDGSKDFRIYLLKAKLQYIKGDHSNGLNNLKEAIRYGCYIDHNIFTNKFFKKVLFRSDSIDLITFAEKNIEIPFSTSKNLALPELYQLVNFDQALRYFTTKFHDSMCIPETKSLHNELIISRKLLKQYLNRFGFPNEKEFGSVLLDRFDKLIIHHKSEIDSCQWLKPFYDKALNDRIISPSRYYNFYESFRIAKNERQQSGAYEGRQKTNGKWSIFSIENIESVDSLREILCLSPLQIFLTNNNFTVPEGYKFHMDLFVQKVRIRLKDRKLRKN